LFLRFQDDESSPAVDYVDPLKGNGHHAPDREKTVDDHPKASARAKNLVRFFHEALQNRLTIVSWRIRYDRVKPQGPGQVDGDVTKDDVGVLDTVALNISLCEPGGAYISVHHPDFSAGHQCSQYDTNYSHASAEVKKSGMGSDFGHHAFE